MENETLRKIDYEDLEKFLQDINYNFAVVENSPLYKGIIGKKGLSITGALGKRGSVFLFVKLVNFQQQFPSQITKGSDITLEYINSKLIDFTEKNKLMLAFGITELVDKDIIVLTNSLMHVFEFEQNKIYSSGISFNESSNISQKIDQIVKDAVDFGLANNPIINSISNIFTSFNTLAKNYADTNNTHTTTSVLPTSVYSPYIQGYTSDGILVDNHKYFGFVDEKFSTNDNGTFVFGSIKKYYQLLQSTINTDTAQTLTSDYATGVGNIPSMVVMQDTYNAGILFGHKNSENLKRFGSIFKNQLNELVIESDSGVNPSEFSRILLHKDYLKYGKLVQFYNDLEVSRDTKLFGDINNKGIRTGKFTDGTNQLVTEIGLPSTSGATKTKLVSQTVDLTEYKTKVLATDDNGVVLKTYSFETAIPSEITPMVGLNSLETNIINSPNKVLTSNYYNYLARKINVVSTFTNSNYWKKSEFHTGVIPSLHLYNTLTVDIDAQIGGVLNISNAERKLQIFGTLTEINSVDVTMSEYKSKVLVTDTNGKIVKTFGVETQILNPNDLLVTNTLTSIGASTNNFITTNYYDHLIKKINSNNYDLKNKYWSKEQFASTLGVAGDIKIGKDNKLISFGDVDFGITGISLFKTYLANSKRFVEIGVSDSETLMDGDITLKKHKDIVLVTDANGKILTTKKIETVKFDETTALIGNNQIPNNVGTSDDTFAMGYHVNWLARKINNLMSFTTSNFWSRSQFGSGIIPNLVLSNLLNAKAIKIGAEENNPNFFTDGGNETSVGKVNGVINIRGNVKLTEKPSVVVVTDSDGLVVNNKLESIQPRSSTHTTTSGLNATEAQIGVAYWEKDVVEPLRGAGSTRTQIFQNYPTVATNHITSNYYNLVINHIKNIRNLLYNRPTFAYCDENYGGAGNGVPNGMIMYWNNAFGAIPIGWVICDGRVIPGLGVATPRMIDVFVEGAFVPNLLTGNTNHETSLSENNIPAHSHIMPAHTHPLNLSKGGARSDGGDDFVKNPNSDTSITNFNTKSGGGGNTNQTGSGSSFSIKPRTIGMIPIMKFWDGRGTLPVTIMPPFATINIITQTYTQNLTYLSVHFSLIDSTVNSAQLQMKRTDGVNANQWVNIIQPTFITVNLWIIQLPFSPTAYTAEFRMVALNGNSFGTNGATSLIKSEIITWISPPIQTTPPKPELFITLNGTYQNSNETVVLDIVADTSQIVINYYEFQVATKINTGSISNWSLLSKEYTGVPILQKPFTVSSSSNPFIFTEKFYRMRIVDINGNLGEFSDAVSIVLNSGYYEI
jgi:hypothetical protein